MNKYRIIDLATWNRRKIFESFQKFDSSVFNVTVSIKAENLYRAAKVHGESFFLMSLYAILRAANSVPQIRQRYIDGQVVEFEKIAAMTPVMTKYETFCQTWCEYEDTFSAFKAAAVPKIETAKNSLPDSGDEYGEDFICCSCLPWLHFDSITQAACSFHQAVPVLAWGKMEKGIIPVSASFSHCFLDGLHVSRFFENMQNSFSDPESLEK